MYNGITAMMIITALATIILHKKKKRAINSNI